MQRAMALRSRHVHKLHKLRDFTALSAGPVAEPEAAPEALHGAGWAVVCDARLDNQADLALELGCADQAESVVLHAYVRWGPDCVLRLRGDFALAVWDPLAERLFLARDRFGVKPLQYAQGEGWFAFASEAKALLALPETPRTSSARRIGEFLSGRMPAADVTMFDAVSRLPAGHRLVVTRDAQRLDRYWDWVLPPPAQGADLPERFRSLFEAAVARRTPEKGPAAVTLSGGLDSSAIAVTLEALVRPTGRRVSTYSIVFDNWPALSERRFIESVLACGDFDPHFTSLDAEDPFDGFERHLESQDGLFLAPTLAMAPDLLAGVSPGSVVFDGHGGDEVVSHGFERLEMLARAGRWPAFWREARGAGRVSGAAWPDLFFDYYRAYGPGGRRLGRLVRRLFGTRGDGLAAVYDLRAPALRNQDDIPPDVTSKPPCARARHMAALADPGQQYALEVLDRKAAARGIESRVPFWDEDLVAFMLSVPADHKLRGGWTRWILREAMRGRLPEAVRRRRDKHDFAHYMTRSLRLSQAAAPARFAVAADRLGPYLNMDAVADVRRRLDGPAPPSGQDLQAIWRAAAVAAWVDFADSNSIRIVS